MLDHISLGMRDMAAARRFYDAVFKPLGYTALHAGDGYAGYGAEAAEFWLMAAERPVAADMANGLHVSFKAASRAAVDAFHAAGLAAGGKDNGAPGPRADYGPRYYAAFLIDPEGYRIEAHTEAA